MQPPWDAIGTIAAILAAIGGVGGFFMHIQDRWERSAPAVSAALRLWEPSSGYVQLLIHIHGRHPVTVQDVLAPTGWRIGLLEPNADIGEWGALVPRPKERWRTAQSLQLDALGLPDNQLIFDLVAERVSGERPLMLTLRVLTAGGARPRRVRSTPANSGAGT